MRSNQLTLNVLTCSCNGGYIGDPPDMRTCPNCKTPGYWGQGDGTLAHWWTWPDKTFSHGWNCVNGRALEAPPTEEDVTGEEEDVLHVF